MARYESLIQRWAPRVEFHQNRYARELDGFVRPGCRWLDLGAGTRVHHGWRGVPQSVLCRRSALFVGCDPMGDHLRRNALVDGAVASLGEHLPFRDASFDLVSANMVLEHLPDPVAVFREVRRVLAPGGAFLFVTPNAEHPVVRLASLLLSVRRRRRLAHRVEGRAMEHIFPTFYAANRAGALRQMALEAGFAAAQVEPFSSYPFARRPALATILECAFIRLTFRPAFRRFSSNLVGSFHTVPVAAIGSAGPRLSGGEVVQEVEGAG